jgi:hypothetical protein
MRNEPSRLSRASLSHSTTIATIGVLVWLLLSFLPAREANGQGAVQFNIRLAAIGFQQTIHVWGPSSTHPALSLIGLGSNDGPSGTTPFGAASGMALIGAGGRDGHFGYASTFAQLLGAVGANQPESALVPVGLTTTFRSGQALGDVAPIVSTLTANPGGYTVIPADAPFATFEIVAWDNSTGLYPNWALAEQAWLRGYIAAGRSNPFNVSAIGGGFNLPPTLNNMQLLQSFNLVQLPEPSAFAVACLGAAALMITRRRR